MTPGSNDRSNSRVAPQLASQEGSTILDIDGRAQPTRPTSLFQEVRNSSRQIIPENVLWGAPNMASFSTWASNRPNPCGTKYPVRLRKPPTHTWIPEGLRQDPGFGRFSRECRRSIISCFCISLVSAPIDTARSISMSPQIRRLNGPPSATRFGSIGCVRIVAGSPGYFSNVAFDGGP